MRCAIAGAVIVVIVGAIALILLSGPELASPSLSLSSSQLDFTLTKLATAVFIEAPGSRSEEVTTEAKVGGGWRIETSAAGRALLESPDETVVTLDQNTNFTIAAHDADARRSELSLAGGRAWTRVKKLLDQDELYEIRTPNAVATVRGTSFSFGYAAQVTTLLVAEGLVGIRALDPASGEPLFATSTLVRAGQKAAVDDRLPLAERIRVMPIADADKDSEWYRFNEPSAANPPPPASLPPWPPPQPSPTLAPSPSPSPTPTPASLPPAPLSIAAVAPDTVTYNPSGAHAIQIAGSGFSGATAVLVGVFTVPFDIKDDATIWFFVDSSVSPGVYPVSVMRGQEQVKRDRALTVLQPPSPQDGKPQTGAILDGAEGGAFLSDKPR